MRKIAHYAGRSLEWTQPAALKMEYELRAGDDLVATLKFRSSFGSLATAESADGCWTFKRVGFLSTRVTVRPCGEEVELSSFRNNTWRGGGTFELADGQKLLANTNLWRSEFQFQTEAEEPLVRLRSGGMVRVHASVDILHAASRVPELPLLVLLGFYLIIMMRRDSTAAA